MAKQCTHLDTIHEVSPSANGCEDCLKTGDTWVHLRICLECGLLNAYGEPVGDVTRALAPKCSSAAVAPDSVALGESRMAG